MKVLRLCSVFEPPAGLALTGRGDPIGGMQNHTAALTRALDARGVPQTILTSRPLGAPARQRFAARSGVVRAGLPVPWCRGMYLAAAAPLARGLASGADLVHVHLGEDLGIGPLAVRVARERGVPLVVTVHTSLRHTLAVGDARSALLKVAGGRVELWTARAAAAVITLTPRLAARLVDDVVERERLHVVPSGVEAAAFDGDGADPFPDIPHPRVVFVGRLHPQKQVQTLIRAARLLATQDAHVVVVGDGPDRQRLEALAAASSRVHLTGFVPHDRVPAVLGHADVFVLPSRYEELGSVLLEAMHAGLPIVASDTGGIPDVVTDGASGLLVPPGDPAALARAIDRLLADRDLAARLGERARAEAAAYDWDVLAGEVLGIYEAALRERPAGAGADAAHSRLGFEPGREPAPGVERPGQAGEQVEVHPADQ